MWRGWLPGHSAIEGSVVADVDNDVEAAYDFVAKGFVSNYQRWCPNVAELEVYGAQAQVGVTVRQVTQERGMRSEWTFRIGDACPPSRFVLEGVSDPIRLIYEFDEIPERRTRVLLRFELNEIELSMRPFAKLIRATLQNGAEQTLQNLKRLLEAERARAGSSGEGLWRDLRSQIPSWRFACVGHGLTCAV